MKPPKLSFLFDDEPSGLRLVAGLSGDQADAKLLIYVGVDVGADELSILHPELAATVAAEIEKRRACREAPEKDEG